MHFDRLFVNARLATMAGRGPIVGLIDRGALGVREGRIAYVGSMADLPEDASAGEKTDCLGRLITPGLIDCHTHLVYAGDRAREFERRLEGASYEDIATEGGGIVSTVRATRAASDEALASESLRRLDALMAEGVTTVEIKSGYGLETGSEAKQLRVARSLATRRAVDIKTTFLGAHALPPEARNDRKAYVDALCQEMLPAIARQGLADAVDAFCESIAFSPAEVGRVFDCAKSLGLPVKLHADQLTNLHGAALAASYGALSADHLEHTDEDGVAAMAKAGTVAVMLPGAFYFLRDTNVPPIETCRRHGVPMAIATDCNPGSSPLTSPLLAMNMAATLFRMTVAECLIGFTRAAAQALGCLADRGTLEIGKRCDLAIWNVETPAALVYPMGHDPLERRIFGGRG